MPPPDRRDARRWFLLATIAFGTSYALLPLYSSNQNHHFLIGIARAGEGWLADDWLVHTVDPFPVFSAFVAIVHRLSLDVVYYVLYYLLLGAYAYGLMRIVEHVWPVRAGTRRVERLLFLAAICVLHNEVIGYLLGVDLPHMPWWQMTHWGVAEQEIFGHSAFQPSSIGLLLPLAIAWHLDGRSLRAITLVGAILIVHFSYIVIAAALTAAFIVVELERTRRLARPAAIGAVALAAALPVLAYVWLRLGPTTPEIATQAASIIVDHIPQEADPAVWLGLKTYVQVALMIVGVLLAAGTDLFPSMLFPLLAGVALTSAQLTSHNPRLALLFPWRVSVLLVPLSTALIVRAVVARLRDASTWRSKEVQRVIGAGAIAAIVISVAAGAVRMALNFAYYDDYRPVTARLTRLLPARWTDDFAKALRPDTLPMMRFVRETAARGDLYLVPPELERFRLVAGAPIVADFKSHPYRDVEVLEWYERLQLVEAFYASGDCGVLATIEGRYGITDVVLDSRVRGSRCAGLRNVYADPIFEIDRVRAEADAKMRSQRPACLTLVAGGRPGRTASSPHLPFFSPLPSPSR